MSELPQTPSPAPQIVLPKQAMDIPDVQSQQGSKPVGEGSTQGPLYPQGFLIDAPDSHGMYCLCDVFHCVWACIDWKFFPVLTEKCTSSMKGFSDPTQLPLPDSEDGKCFFLLSSIMHRVDQLRWIPGDIGDSLLTRRDYRKEGLDERTPQGAASVEVAKDSLEASALYMRSIMHLSKSDCISKWVEC